MSFAGELVEFPHRNPVLPKIYRWHGRHVKSPKFGNHTRTTYLALLDNSPEGLKALIEYIEKASIPTSTDDDELFNQGEILSVIMRDVLRRPPLQAVCECRAGLHD